MALRPILHLDDASTWRGGEQQVLYLHQGLLVEGHDSRVVCREGSAFHERLRTEQLPHYALPMRGGHDLASAWSIARLQKNSGGILHAHTSHAHDLALWAGRLGGGGPIVVSRRVDFPVGTSLLSKAKYLSRRVDRYLAISSAVEHELTVAGIAADRIRRVPSGVDFSRFDGQTADNAWRASLGLAPSEILFGNVAALAPHKDQRTLLLAFAKFLANGGQGKLVILGEGELRADLESLRAELGLEDSVWMPGFVSEVLPKVAAMDVFVMSSSTEGLGTSILDAMALSRPVVATSAGGIVDAVEDQRTGLLAPPGDAPAFAAALAKMQQSATLRAEYGRAGREKVEDFDVQRTVELTISAYGELGSA